MKKTIVILGSTGSIGKTLIDIIDKKKKNFEIKLLTANKNYKVLLKQAKKFNVKNIIITNKNNYQTIKKKCTKLNINVFNNFNDIDLILKKGDILGISFVATKFSVIIFLPGIEI